MNERMNAAAPEGTPPRRISDKEIQKLPAPPCLGEALRRGTLQKNVIISKENDVIQKTWDKVKSKIAVISALQSS